MNSKTAPTIDDPQIDRASYADSLLGREGSFVLKYLLNARVTESATTSRHPDESSRRRLSRQT
jgi:hypothetical protein